MRAVMRSRLLLAILLLVSATGCGSGSRFLAYFDVDLIADDDAYVTRVGATLVVPASEGVLANDRGPYLRARLVDPPAHGTLEFAEDGGFSFSPEPSFFGSDSFEYEINADGHADRAQVALAINREFEMTLSLPRIDLVQGSSENLVVTLNALDSIDPPLSVTVALEGVPAGVGVSPLQITTTASGTATFAISTTLATPQSLWTIATVTASGMTPHQQSLPVRVRGKSGSLDKTFGLDGVAWLSSLPPYSRCDGIAPTGDRKLAFVGTKFADSKYKPIVGRLLETGRWDIGFADGGFTNNFADRGYLQRIRVLDDRSVLVAGTVWSPFTSLPTAGFGRFLPDGQYDGNFGDGFFHDFGTAFGEPGDSWGFGLDMFSDGGIVTFGRQADDWAVVAAYRPNGTSDASFGTASGIFRFKWHDLAPYAFGRVDSLDRVVQIGYASDGTGFMARLTPSGQYDPTFGTGGTRSMPFRANSLVLTTNGSFLAGAWDDETDIHIFAIDSSGNPVAGFGTDGELVLDGGNYEWGAVELDGDRNRFIVFGGVRPDPSSYGQKLLIGRYFSDGSPDASFNGTGPYRVISDPDPEASLYAIAMTTDEDGRIVVCGQRSAPVVGPSSPFVMRIWP